MICGTNLWYTANAGCVACIISRSKMRYAGLDEKEKAAHKARDQARHMKNKLPGNE
jgi:hypothetical protein